MTLITVLISLVLERFIGYLDEFRQLGWFRQYAQFIRNALGGIADGVVGVVLILIGPAVVVWGVSALLDDVMLGLLEIIFGVVVLIYCLGPKDLHQQVEAVMEASAVEDEERLNKAASKLICGEPPTDRAACLRKVVEAIFVEANGRTLAVLFWFVVLGPLGAVVYRLSHELVNSTEEDSSFKRMAELWLGITDWVPARLTAFFYALTGNFDDALPVLRRYLLKGLPDINATNRALLRESGVEGVELGEFLKNDLDATQVSLVLAGATNMVMRTIVLAVTVLAVATLGGWAS